MIQRLIISSACHFHSPRTDHTTILGDYQATACTAEEDTDKNIERKGRHPSRGKQFASIQEGLKSVACVHQRLWGDHNTLPRKYQHHPPSIEESTKGLSSGEGRFSLCWAKYALFNSTLNLSTREGSL